MSQLFSGDLIKRITENINIDLSGATVEQILSVYKLALQEISEILKPDVQTIPVSSLQEIKEALNTISVGLMVIRNQQIKIDIANVIQSVSPYIDEALASIVAALTILDEKGKSFEYYNLLINCAEKIRQILMLFKTFSISLPPKINNQQPIADEINPISISTQTMQPVSASTSASDIPEIVDGTTTSSTNMQPTPVSSNLIGTIEQETSTTNEKFEQVEIAVRAIADRPSDEDLLDFNDYAVALVDFIVNEKTEKPLTIVIDAPWGMGKSTLMGLIKSELEKRAKANKQRPFPMVWFNAWKYDQESSLWAALALKILGDVRKQYNVWRRFMLSANLMMKRLNGNIIFSALFKAVPYIFGLILIVGILFLVARIWLGSTFLDTIQKSIASIGILGAITVTYAFMRDIYSKIKPLDQKISKYVHAPNYYIRAPNYKEKIGFLAEFEDDFKSIVASVADKDRPLIIFIDDLDRCSPPKPVEIIEAINILLDSRCCVFVIGMDAQTVAGSIEAKYKDLKEYLKDFDDPGGLTLGERFLEKIVQINFHIPRADAEIVKKFIEKNLQANLGEVKDGQSINPSSEEVRKTEGMIEEELTKGKTLDEAVKAVQSTSPEIEDKLLEEAKQRVFTKTFDDSEDVKDAIHEAALYLGFNPRKIKRFINVFRLQALIANRRGLIEIGTIQLRLLAKWITIVTRWPDLVEAMLIDQNFVKSLKEAFAASEELSQSDDKFLVSAKGKKIQAKYDLYIANPHIKRLVDAKDLMNLLKQMSDAEIEALPQYLRLTQTTISTNIIVEPPNPSVSNQQTKQ